MSREKVPAEERLKRAEANGYKQCAHQAEDNIKDNTVCEEDPGGSTLGIGTL